VTKLETDGNPVPLITFPNFRKSGVGIETVVNLEPCPISLIIYNYKGIARRR
jgi:hypothetical protein